MGDTVLSRGLRLDDLVKSLPVPFFFNDYTTERGCTRSLSYGEWGKNGGSGKVLSMKEGIRGIEESLKWRERQRAQRWNKGSLG